MRIYIPTIGRTGLQRTWDAIPGDWRPWAYLVCPADEAKAHYRAGRRVVVCTEKGIGPVRHWIMQNAPCDKVLMLDDDLKFNVKGPRRDGLPGDGTRNSPKFGLYDVTPNTMSAMLHEVRRRLTVYAHGSIVPRFGCNGIADDEECTRGLRALAYRTDIFRRHKLRFDAVPLMEDFYVQLSLLTRGYKSFTITDWVQDQPGKSGAAGGCSTYRTAELQETAARALAKAFHPDAKLITKTVKTKWGDLGTTRADVRIQWKAAYETGRMLYGARGEL